MKKNINIIANLLFDITSKVIILGGVIMLVSSFFITVSTFQATIIVVLGLIMHGITSMHNKYLEMINLLAAVLEKANNQKTENNVSVEEILITNKTTPEELNKIKEKYPELKDKLDDLLNDIEKGDIIKNTIDYYVKGEDNLDKFLEELEYKMIDFKIIKKDNIQKLEEELKKAIENDEFEIAAEIRDKINKLKM